MSYRNLLIEKEKGLGWIIINRPDKLNVLNAETVKELYEAFFSLQESSGVRVVILTGAGDKAFIAGADLLLICQDQQKVVRAVQAVSKAHADRVISPERLQASLERLDKVRARFLYQVASKF